jgi:hypothetical protein
MKVEPGDEVTMLAAWSNWCDGYVRAARLRLSWPGEGPDSKDAPGADVMTTPFQPSPSCQDHTRRSLLTLDGVIVNGPAESRAGMTPSEPPSTAPDPGLLRAAGRWSAAMQSYAQCLREHGAEVDGPGEDFTLGIGGPQRAEAQAACDPPKVALAGGYDANVLWAALHPNAAAERTPTAYPTNAHGLTYGSAAGSPGPEHPEDGPDLIAVESSGGTGYVYSYELNGGPGAWVTNPQQAQDYMNSSPQPRTLTAYKSDGITKVGTFTVG